MIIRPLKVVKSLTQDDRILLFFIFLLLISNLDVYFVGARYLKYTIGIFSIIVFALKGGRLSNELSPTHWAFLGLCAWGGISLLWGDTSNGLKDIIFIATYTLPFIVLRPSSNLIDISFPLTIIFFLLTLPAREIGHFSLQDSQGLFEGGMSFVFGIYAIYYLSIKKYILHVICLILVAITLKRIVLLGIIVAIVINVLPKRIQQSSMMQYSVLLISGTVVLGIFFLTTGWMDEEIKNITGMNVAQLTLGRTYHYYGVVYDVLQNPFGVIFGNGVGSAYEKATTAYSGDALTPNLHSDTLKILYEYGILFFIIFFTCLGRWKNTGAQILTIYTSIVLITDNTLIYSNVMFVYILCFTVLNSRSKKVPACEKRQSAGAFSPRTVVQTTRKSNYKTD